MRRHRAFLKREPADRPVFVANIGFFMPEVFPALSEALPRGLVSPDDIRIDLFLADVERLVSKYQQLGDDLPYVAAPFAYVPWLEAIMGCPTYAAEISMWAEPCVADWKAWHWQPPVLEDNPWCRKLLELFRVLVAHSAGRYQVGHTLMRGVADLLSAMRGASNFALDFYDCPDEVQRAADFLANVWIDVARAQLDLVPPSEQGYAGGAGWRVWTPDRLAWLQEDAMALMSPALFRKFVLPRDRRILSHFPCTGFHLHASALWAVDDLARLPELDILELNYESARSDEEGTFAAWTRIQAQKPLIIWKQFDGQPFWDWLKRVREQLSAGGLALFVTTANLEEALDVKEAVLGEQW
jgi:hypothetical protein